MTLEKARVSIGMPVYNGQKFISYAIDSILKQTHTDFELIISDNSSTDNTQQICLNYMQHDARIHYFRNERNIGGPNNYNRVFEKSTGEYFKWAAYDDVLAPDYLRRCVEILDRDPSVVGCHCKTGRIDQNGNLIGYYNEGLLKRIASKKAHERFRDLIGLYYTTTPFHGVYRRNFFAKSQLHGSYIGADRNLVAELSLMGRILELPECLFYWRDHPDSYTSIFYGSRREDTLDRLKAESAWWSKDNGTYFPHWKNCTEYFKSVRRVNLKLSERFLCYLTIMQWFFVEGSRFIGRDIMLFMFQHSLMSERIFRLVPKRITTKIL